MQTYAYPSVLAIAGFDGSGGAGIQADIKTISAHGCYATTVLTSLPIQNTLGVQSIHHIPAQVVADQMTSIMVDITPEVIKIGMVANNSILTEIIRLFNNYPQIPIVLDPVMVSSSGHRLLEEDACATMLERLFPIATLVTPNLDEASVLAGMPIISVDDMYLAGAKIKRHCKALLLKGGHLERKQLVSLYFDEAGEVHIFESPRLETANTHGTGCTLSSAIAANIAKGESMMTALSNAQDYVHQAILNAADVRMGGGKGSLNHFFNPDKLIKKPI
jgi:hydroxymethylpyrimidine/phosphomethylpyrimidine kinase